MRAKKIYLIRHGQTEYNKMGIVQGSGVNIGLNETGKQQAAAFHQAYHSVPFDKIYSSALLRAKESVQAFLDDGHRYECFSGLNEINWGNKEGQRIDIQENAYYQSMLHAWKMGHTDKKIEGGESPEDVQLRIRPVLREMLEDNSTSTILICMHGRSMRILLATLLNYPLAYMDLFRHENLCLYTLVHTGSLCRVEDYCNTDHLKESARHT